MRLTLRTLIAWLDDTLTPAEVRAIGQQVAESPFAKELVERVQRVTRQRRLTYPGRQRARKRSDPNLVAGYLDNELAPEQVAEYEKRCLTSDVHLAEVASVHQILSLIGQKAKVPADAKLRMYRLVRGRETTKGQAPAGRQAESGTAAPSRRSPSRSRRGRSHPADSPACSSGSGRRRRAGADRLARTGRPSTASETRAPNPHGRLDLSRSRPSTPSRADPGQTQASPAAGPVADVPTPPAEDRTAQARGAQGLPRPSTPEDVGSFEAIQGVVLRANAEGNGWDRVEAKAPLKERSRLLNLAPFRNTLKLGKSEVDLVDSTDVVIDDSEKDQSGPTGVEAGPDRRFRPSAGSPPFAVRFEGQVLAITPPPGVAVGVERIPTLLPGPVGARTRSAPDLRARRPGRPQGRRGRGDAERAGRDLAPDLRQVRREGPAADARPGSPRPTPSGFSKEVGDQFVALLRPGRPILADLVEAMDDPQKDVKRMAIYALGSIGSMEQVVEVVSRKEDATVHRAGDRGASLRPGQGGETAKSVREALVRQYDQPWAEVTEKLLVGYGPRKPRMRPRWSSWSNTSPTPRAGGPASWRSTTSGRSPAATASNTTPTTPKGKGLKAWQDLVRKKEPTRKLDRLPGPNDR